LHFLIAHAPADFVLFSAVNLRRLLATEEMDGDEVISLIFF
jgi:hypothetical protein